MIQSRPSLRSSATRRCPSWASFSAESYKRRRRLLVAADFGVARLGSSRRHGFFVTVHFPFDLAIRDCPLAHIDYSFTTHIFKHSKGKDLPVQVDPDEEVRILFDIDAASKHIATYSVRPPPNRSRRDT